MFLGSPQYEAEVLGDELGLRLVCKVETENPIRSFKVDTIADGIAVRVPVEEALSDLSGVVDDGTMVRAMRLLFWKMGLVVEPAGAAGIAALLAHSERFAGALVAKPLCGGNLTGQQIRRWLLEDASGSEVKPPDG